MLLPDVRYVIQNTDADRLFYADDRHDMENLYHWAELDDSFVCRWEVNGSYMDRMLDAIAETGGEVRVVVNGKLVGQP